MKLLIVAAVAVLAPAMAQAETLELVCEGVATLETTETSKVDTGISNGFGTNHQMTVKSDGVRKIDSSVSVSLRDEGVSEIKIPGSFVPVWASKSREGWRPITDLAVADDKITGGFKLNAINHPDFIINRKTGRMELSMWGGFFRGDCAKAPDKDTPNKF